MAKTKYNEAATRYANDYLEHLLSMEDVLGEKVQKRVDELVERKVQQYMAHLGRVAASKGAAPVADGDKEKNKND